MDSPSTEKTNKGLPEYPFRHEGAVIVRGNKAVVRGRELRHMCGYIALPANEVPQEWHGECNADALQYLAVHGGITYCEVASEDNTARYAAARAAHEAIPFSYQPGGDLSAATDAMRARREAEKAAKLSIPYEWVVFGFDCGHSGDEENDALRDPEHVYALTEDMERVLLAYRDVIVQWRAAGRQQRANMIDEVNKLAQHKGAASFGAMIGILSGAPEFGEEPTVQ